MMVTCACTRTCKPHQTLTPSPQYITHHRRRRQAGEKSWHDLALEPTPTLLPDMRFHDLVFGHELGSGAFSTVRYARHIAKGKTRSEWSEYAVKVVDTGKVAAQGYERCVAREIAVLRLLSHPGIARMVSAFRWREGAYLVLEFAAKGDLHTHLVGAGSVDEPSARFVVGEVLAALRSVHDAGCVCVCVEDVDSVWVGGRVCMLWIGDGTVRNTELSPSTP